MSRLNEQFWLKIINFKLCLQYLKGKLLFDDPASILEYVRGERCASKVKGELHDIWGLPACL